MSTDRFHVIKSTSGEWRVKRTGDSRAISKHANKDEAIDKARKLAKQSTGEVIVHGVDGTIKDVRSYKRDRKI
jgi:diacylglycerol kinase family enzyme